MTIYWNDNNRPEDRQAFWQALAGMFLFLAFCAAVLPGVLS